MTMTKKHFQAMADCINTVGKNNQNKGYPFVLLPVAQEMADYFATINPRFDRAKFMSACFRYQRGE